MSNLWQIWSSRPRLSSNKTSSYGFKYSNYQPSRSLASWFRNIGPSHSQSQQPFHSKRLVLDSNDNIRAKMVTFDLITNDIVLSLKWFKLINVINMVPFLLKVNNTISCFFTKSQFYSKITLFFTFTNLASMISNSDIFS